MFDVWKLFGLGFTFILSNYLFIIFFYFIKKIYGSKKSIKEILPFLGIAFLFLFGGISYIFANLFDYFQWHYEIKILIHFRLHSILYFASIASCIFVYEYVIKKTKYLLTIYILIGLIANFIVYTYEALNFLLNLFLGSAIPILLILQYVVFVRPTSGMLKRRMYISLVGLISAGVGSALRNYFINEFLGYYIFSIGTSIVIIGLLLMAYGFSAFSTLTDLKWKDKLYQLYVVTENGICLYAHSFENNLPITNSELLATGFSGIQKLLSEILKTKEALRIIEYKNLKILIDFGPNIVFLLVISEQSAFLFYKLKEFSEKFSNFFKDLLKNWQGNTEIFTPTKSLIQSIFELNL
ncbi:MAG: hypothetical protein HWN67_09185 [Candidatus Helarchaeota archaeon]|nr:hypothetical protein [Candidatus Helarchaeota archaeon]